MVNIMLNKKSYAIIVLSILLVALFLQLNVVYAAEETAIDTGDVLVFLRDVVQLDTSKYEVRLTTKATNYWPKFGGVAQTTGQYTLDSTGLVGSTCECGTSILTVNFAFWDQELISCSFYEVSQGPPMYSKQPVTDLRTAASDFLQRYQARTGDAQLTQMRSLLDMVEVTSNTTKTVDNLSLEVLVEDNKTLFTWGNTLNGTDYSRLRLNFQEGQFSSFGDDRSFYKLGSSEVNISQEEALNVALKRVESFTYTYMGKNITITSSNIVKEESLLHFSFLNRTNRFELYPCWIVELPLDDLYPPDIAIIKVMLWADSGEVISAVALGYGFSYDPSPTPAPVTENTKPNNNNAALSPVYIVAACVAIAIPIAVIAVALKKRRK
jgi:hypothetical protein